MFLQSFEGIALLSSSLWYYCRETWCRFNLTRPSFHRLRSSLYPRSSKVSPWHTLVCVCFPPCVSAWKRTILTWKTVLDYFVHDFFHSSLSVLSFWISYYLDNVTSHSFWVFALLFGRVPQFYLPIYKISIIMLQNLFKAPFSSKVLVLYHSATVSRLKYLFLFPGRY